jgi:ribosomal protein S20
MKKITLVAGLALILVVPATSVAKPTPDKGDKRAAKTECKTLRGHSDATREAFRTQFRNFAACVKAHAADEAQEEQSAHTNAAKDCKAEGLHGREFGKCVSEKAKAKEHEADAQDQQDATEFKNAAKECDSMRDTDAAAFAAQYGTAKNAFGKCVSQKAREQHAQDEGETETPPAS